MRRKVQAEGVSYKTCPTCNGSGQANASYQYHIGKNANSSYLFTCSGAGEMISSKPNGCRCTRFSCREETVSINIPEGVTEGVQLKVGGKGNDAPGNNSIAGDLLVLIEEIPHRHLKREGTNIHYDLYVNFQKLF